MPWRLLTALAALSIIACSGCQKLDMKKLGDQCGHRLECTEGMLCHGGVCTFCDVSSLDVKEFQCMDPYIKSLEPLRGATKLISLDVGFTNVGDVKLISTFTSLQLLHLARTRVHDISGLAMLTRLRELDLRYTKVTTLRPLHNLKQLRKLFLFSTQITKREIQELKKRSPWVLVDGCDRPGQFPCARGKDDGAVPGGPKRPFGK